jgi:lysophospholipase L1-like esterase
MKRIIFLLVLSVLVVFFTAGKHYHKYQSSPVMDTYRLLALGDSYTIGESIPRKDNFPNQLTALLRNEGLGFGDAEIVAKTGWTTDELLAAMQKQAFHPPYDFVTLLVGVNNQYRGRSLENYRVEFEQLLQWAITLSGNRPGRVIVLSIPDWGVTPFAAGRDRAQIAREIDLFNQANAAISDRYATQYINITTGTREAAIDETLVAADGLHPSAKEYAKWAQAIAGLIKKQLEPLN